MRTTSEPGWDHRAEVAGLPLFWRQVHGEGNPVVYLHGVPTNSDDFLPFLDRTGGVAPDLPGFGRSGKPAAFDYSLAGYARFLEAFIDRLELPRFSLVIHDWGAVGLVLPERLLTRLDRLVVINAVPLFAGYRWHRIARLWRTPVIGELTMGFSSRRRLKRFSGGALARPGPLPDFFVDRIWDHFDHGTQRAILKLYRSAPAEELGRAGRRLAEIRCPALVLWGALDPYIASAFAHEYAGALAGETRLELIDDASHWPWLDRPDVVDTVVRFLGP